jgi:hypothetical protein
MDRQGLAPFDGALWFQWIMATTVGWVLGRFLLPNISFLVIGVAIGILQWFVLQHRIRKAWQWILATSTGWMLGALVILIVLPAGMDFLAGVAAGLATGTAQWLILRHEIQWAGWWIIINVVAWTTGMALLPGILLTGTMVGAITGIALVLLLRFPKSIEVTPGE